MQVWDFATNEILSVNQLPVFDPAGKWFALNRDGAVVVFDSNTGKEIAQLEDSSAGHLHFLQPNYLISIKPTGEAREDDVVRVWNTHTWEAMRPTLIKGRHLSEYKMSMVGERAIQYLFEDGHLLILMPSGAFEYHDLIHGKNKSENKSIAEDFRKLTDDRFRPYNRFNPSGHSCFSYKINRTAIQAHAHTEDGNLGNKFSRLEYDLKAGQLRGHQSVDVFGEVIGFWLDRNKAPSLEFQLLFGSSSLVKNELAESWPLGNDSLNWMFPQSAMHYGITTNRLIADGDSVLFIDGGKLETIYKLKRSKQDLLSSEIPSALVGLDVYKDFAILPHSFKRGAVACYLQDASGLHQVATLETKSPVLDLVRSRSGNLIAAICGGDGTSSVALIGMPALNEQAVLKIKQGRLSSVAISEDDALVAVCEQLETKYDRTLGGSIDECIINIYDSKTGEAKRLLKAPGGISSMAFTADSSRIGVGTGNQHYIWSLQNEHAPEVFSIDGKEIVFNPLTGKMVEQRERLRYRSESIVFRTNEKAMSVLSEHNKLQFVEWDTIKQKTVFCFNQPMKFLRTDDNDKDIVYVETPRLPGIQGIDGNEIVALNVTQKQIVKRFSTRFARGRARDVDPKRGLILGIEHKDGQNTDIFLTNGSTGKVECSMDTSMQYVNDAVCLPQGLFIVGGHMPPKDSIEIVDLKTGTTVKNLENQSLLSFGSCRGFNYLITRNIFPKADQLHFWRLEDGSRFASVPHVGLQRVVISPSEERVASISGEAIFVWSVQQLKDGFEKK